jgi:hypothetical protein
MTVYKPGEESNAIDFLLRVSIPQFAGNSQSEFWNRHVLQLAQQDVATKHALISLAHLHRDFTKSGSHEQHNQPALHHYNTAIRSHIKSLSGQMENTLDSGSAMTTAIVFICIEIMQGHLASAVSLLQHSVAMLPKSGNQQVHLYEDIISRLQIHARRVSNPSTTCLKQSYIYKTQSLSTRTCSDQNPAITLPKKWYQSTKHQTTGTTPAETY